MGNTKSVFEKTTLPKSTVALLIFHLVLVESSRLLHFIHFLRFGRDNRLRPWDYNYQSTNIEPLCPVHPKKKLSIKMQIFKLVYCSCKDEDWFVKIRTWFAAADPGFSSGGVNH